MDKSLTVKREIIKIEPNPFEPYVLERLCWRLSIHWENADPLVSPPNSDLIRLDGVSLPYGRHVFGGAAVPLLWRGVFEAQDTLRGQACIVHVETLDPDVRPRH